MLVATLEEQQVAIEVLEIGTPGSKALMGESWLGKAPEGFGPIMSLATAVPLQVCCSHLSLMSGAV